MLGAPSLQDWQVPCCSFSTCDPEVAICRKQVQKGHYTDPRQAKNLCIKHCPSELCPTCATPTPSTGPHLSTYLPYAYLPIYKDKCRLFSALFTDRESCACTPGFRRLHQIPGHRLTLYLVQELRLECWTKKIN